MSCLIANGRTEQCKDSISGIDSIFFINFEDLDIENVTYATGGDDITLITGVTDLYKYELKGANSFEQNIMSSRENGTTYFEQVLTIQMKRQDVATHKNVKFLAYGRPKIVVHTRSNQWFLMGLNEGADVNAGKVSTGSAYGDFNGYELTFQSNERIPANFLTDGTGGDLADENALKDLFNNAVDPVTIHDN
tara:strand:+ start:1716 stop:2291 length:576 start_codon:yes stop_codon:yes gene_type:complete